MVAQKTTLLHGASGTPAHGVWRIAQNVAPNQPCLPTARVSWGMGFFSYTCAKTNLPILASTSWGGEESEVVVLFDDGSIMKGAYDGYGRVLTSVGSELELDYSSVLNGSVKLVLKKFYNGEDFSGLGRSWDEPGQGHFHDPEKIREWFAQGGFPSRAAYIEAFRNLG